MSSAKNLWRPLSDHLIPVRNAELTPAQLRWSERAFLQEFKAQRTATRMARPANVSAVQRTKAHRPGRGEPHSLFALTFHSQLEGNILKFKSAMSLSVALTGALVLSACGGGGDSEAAPKSLSPLQQAVTDGLSKSGHHNVSSRLTAFNPVAGYMISIQSVLAGPLSTTPQRLVQTVNNMPTTLPLPDFETLPSNRALVDGKVVVASSYDKVNEWIYNDGEQVVVETRATDGVTVYSRSRYTGYESLPLSGLVASAPADVRRASSLSVLYSLNPMQPRSLLKADAIFLPGSAYFKRTVKREGELVYLNDCTNAVTRGVDLSPCAAASLETAFPYTHSGVTYQFTDGTVQTIQGHRAWVAAAAMPEATAPTESRLMLIEREGKVYIGGVQHHGATLRTRQDDGTVVDHSVRLNQKAFESVKTALDF